MEQQFQQILFVLKATPYKEYGQIVEVFTQKDGRFSIFVNGSRRPTSPLKAILQPFNLICADIKTKNNYKTLSNVQLVQTICLKNLSLICANYINELIYYLLEENIPHPIIFKKYFIALQYLSSQTLLEPILRQFELSILDDIGYGINFLFDSNGNRIVPKSYYLYDIESGFVHVSNNQVNSFNVFIGSDILTIGKSEFEQKHILKILKKICRMNINFRLGSRHIVSRELYSQFISRR